MSGKQPTGKQVVAVWVVSQTGFVSLVQDRKDPSKVWVRARIKEDIAMMFPAYAEHIITKIGADYIYRLLIPKEVASMAMWNAVADITYTSHAKEEMNKRSHPNKDRMGAYYSIWTALAKLQPFAPYSHVPRPVPGMAPHVHQPAFSGGTVYDNPKYDARGHYDWSTHPDSATGFRNGEALTEADYAVESGDAVDLIHDGDDTEEWTDDNGTVYNSVEDWESYLESKAAGRVKAPRKRNPRRNRKSKGQK